MDGRDLFTCGPEGVQEARRWAGKWCASHGCAEQADALQLVISELVSQARVYCEGPVEVQLERRRHRILGVVLDDVPIVPTRDGWAYIDTLRDQITRQLTDSLRFDLHEVGTAVRFVLRIE